MGHSSPRRNRYFRKANYDLREERGRTAAWRKAIINCRNKNGYNYSRTCWNSWLGSDCNITIRRVHLTALHHGDDALMVRLRGIGMIRVVQ